MVPYSSRVQRENRGSDRLFKERFISLKMYDDLKIEPGTLIGRYEIIERIGEDGLARVYLARDPELQRRVAIRISYPEYDREWDPSAPIVNEARILADLQHPSILPVFDTGRLNNLTYLVHEYLPGSLQRELLQDSTALSPDRIVEIVTRMAEALDFVHRRGYLHRNIKPPVILLDATGQPRLSGFGVAVQKDDSDPTFAGSPPYMAPEQVRSERLGPYTDVWGLGVTLYQSLTRELPFKGGGINELAAAILNADPTPIREINGSLPRTLEQICMKCLTKEPEQRYANANLLAAALREWPRSGQPQKQQRVFVSHATKDRDFVEREIISILENNGIATWYSKVDIQTAAEWQRSILQGLQSTDWFLLVMSTQSADSEWVRDELYWAIENRVGRLVPVLIDDSEPRQFHMRMARIQHIDFRVNQKEAQQRLVATFQEKASAE